MSESGDSHNEDNGNGDVGNRERILQVAERLFATKGYHATSVREIVNAANVTSPMLYYYFGSKEDLLVTLLIELTESFIERLATHTASAQSAQDIVTAWCDAFVEESSEATGSLRFVLAMLYGPSPEKARWSLFSQLQTLREEFRSQIRQYHPELSNERLDFVRESIFNLLDPYLYPVISGWADTVGDDVVDAISARVCAMLQDDLPIPENTMRRNRDLIDERLEKFNQSSSNGASS
jgi:AcrR family transcriptional regulator